LKKSFANFWRRNLGFARLAIVTNLEYRVNYLTDAILQPGIATAIELTLWYAIFAKSGVTELAGFGRESYIAYALWGAFVARLTTSWMYEFRMIEDIEMGSVNSLLARPVSFFEYYTSQFMGYKIITTAISLVVPLGACFAMRLPVHYDRLPMMILLCLYYLLLVQTISFCIACLAFRLNKVGSFTMAKNLGLWLFSGELFPLDMLPQPWRDILIAIPFSNAVFVPVGYLTGRVGMETVLQGFASITIGIALTGMLGAYMWKSGLRIYSGTGA
jgi:ABC-2 type transport system permease protein